MWSTGHWDFITLNSHSWKRSSDCLPGDLYLVSKPLACMQCVGCVQKFARGFSELENVVAPASLLLGIWLDCIYLTRVAQFMLYRVRVTKWPSNDNQDQHPYKSVVSFQVWREHCMTLALWRLYKISWISLCSGLYLKCPYISVLHQ